MLVVGKYIGGDAERHYCLDCMFEVSDGTLTYCLGCMFRDGTKQHTQTIEAHRQVPGTYDQVTRGQQPGVYKEQQLQDKTPPPCLIPAAPFPTALSRVTGLKPGC